MEAEDLTDWMEGEGGVTHRLLVEGNEMTAAGGGLMAALCGGAALAL